MSFQIIYVSDNKIGSFYQVDFFNIFQVPYLKHFLTELLNAAHFPQSKTTKNRKSQKNPLMPKFQDSNDIP